MNSIPTYSTTSNKVVSNVFVVMSSLKIPIRSLGAICRKCTLSRGKFQDWSAQDNHGDLRVLYRGDTSVALYRNAFVYTRDCEKQIFFLFIFSLSLSLCLWSRLVLSDEWVSKLYSIYFVLSRHVF